MEGNQVTRVEFLHAAVGSGGGGSPSASRVIDGPAGYVFVGQPVSDEVRAQIAAHHPIAPGEVVGFVPDDVVTRLRLDGA